MLTDDYLFHVYDSADSSEMGKHRAGIRAIQCAVLKHVAKMMLDDGDQSIETVAWAKKLKQMSEGV